MQVEATHPASLTARGTALVGAVMALQAALFGQGVSPPPSAPAAGIQALGTMTTPGGEVFVRDYGPSWIGHGVKYNPVMNTYEMADRVANLQVGPESTLPARFRIYYEEHHSNQRSLRTTSGELELSAAIDLFSASASFAYSSESREEYDSSSFSLIWEVEYPRAGVDLSPSAVDYSPAAEELLALNDPLDIQQKWADRFGTYVVIGAPRFASFRMNISLASGASSEASQTMASLQAAYAGFSGKASFAEALSTAQSYSDLVFSVEAEGVDLTGFSLPSPSTLSTQAGKAQFIDDIESLFELNEQGAPSGVILSPVMALPGAAQLHPQDFDQIAMLQASTAVRQAMAALSHAGHWQRSARLRLFLQELSVPSTGATFREEFQSRGASIANKLSALWAAVRNHLRYPGSAQSLDELRNARLATTNAVTELEDLLLELEDELSAMSAQPVAIDNTVYRYQSPAPVGYQQVFHVRLENVAIFDETDLLDVRPFLLERTHLYSEDGNALVDYPKYDLYLDSTPQITQSGQGRGLFNVEYKFTAKVYTNSTLVEFRLYDDLGRPYWFQKTW